jgi:hypothetical protein
LAVTARFLLEMVGEGEASEHAQMENFMYKSSSFRLLFRLFFSFFRYARFYRIFLVFFRTFAFSFYSFFPRFFVLFTVYFLPTRLATSYRKFRYGFVSLKSCKRIRRVAFCSHEGV